MKAAGASSAIGIMVPMPVSYTTKAGIVQAIAIRN